MHEAIKAYAAKNLQYFTRLIMPGNVFMPFHVTYYELLEKFAEGIIPKMIVTIPPQNGKSEGSSRILPAWILGREPDTRIAIGSYAGSFAQQFNRSIQRIMTEEVYLQIFPETILPRNEEIKSKRTTYIRTGNKFEIIGHKGSLKAVGRGGPLTGEPVDVMIMDDLFKDAMEAFSPVIRESAWNWYTDVVRNRYHNGTKELIVTTRWHEEDIVGRIGTIEKIHKCTCWKEVEGVPVNEWVYVNWEAIKTGTPTEFDQREEGQPLWAERHSLQKLQDQYNLDPIRFECMHQGNPEAREGMLYGEFKTYEALPDDITKRGNYTDTADQGDDYLCSICYDRGRDGKIYITDVVYTQAAMEETEKLVSMQLQRAGTREADIESNNGGRSFARVIQEKCKQVSVSWFHQSNNKESRILTNSALVTANIFMPIDWSSRWPEFYKAIKLFKRIYSANKYKDAPDALTGIIEKNVLQRPRGVRRAN